jgi:DNA modification methylase
VSSQSQHSLDFGAECLFAPGDVTLLEGDCRDVMRGIPECQFDSVVSDPPYGLGFMGKGWDHGVPGPEFWEEALRVTKPGAHLLAFGGTRTFHRLACSIEDAGWELRDTLMWVYGSGFPKSLNIARVFDEADEAERWVGWGTALKPAWEPIMLARRPTVGTTLDNIKTFGVGALNIDACRVPAGDEQLKAGAGGMPRHDEHTPRGRAGEPSASRRYAGRGGTDFAALPGPRGGSEQGRWPANLIHDGSEEVLACFPDAPGAIHPVTGQEQSHVTKNAFGHFARGGSKSVPRGDGGSAARFFYCSKASRTDRDEGCEYLEPQQQDESRKEGAPGGDNPRNRGAKKRGNYHPTVKPTPLMRYLCRLVTPPGGLILDPFMGSGSTGKAAVLEGMRFVGIDNTAEYIPIARARIERAQGRRSD